MVRIGASASIMRMFRGSALTFVAAFATFVAPLLLGVGCQRQMLPASAVDRFPTADDELDFLDEVNGMTAVTNNDALHAFFILADGVDPASTYEERVTTAKERRWVPSGFGPPANESAAVGWLAMAGCQICDIKGGLTMHVLGPSPRYCTKELVFMRVLPLRTENQSLSGAEFVDYLNRLHRVRVGSPVSQLLVPSEEGPAGEQSATPMDEADVEEMLPSPSAPAPAVPPSGGAGSASGGSGGSGGAGGSGGSG